MFNYDVKKSIHTAVICFVITVLTGLTVFFRINLIKYENDLNGRFEIAVFLNKNVTAPEVIGEKIRSIKNVKNLIFISKDTLQEKLKNYQNEILIAGENPFPDAFSVTLNEINIRKTQDTLDQIKTLIGIEEIRYDKSLLELIEKLKAVTRITELVLRVVLTVFFIVFIVGLMVDYFSNKTNFIMNMEKSAINYLSGSAGTIIAVIFVASFKRIFSLDNSFAGISRKWYLLIFLTGIAACIMESAINHIKTKKNLK